MRVIDLIHSNEKTAFSFEILPPLKGTGIENYAETSIPCASSIPNISTLPRIEANTYTKIWATDCFNATG